ncbi:MAG: Tungstate uptake system permease protein TupB [Promethearchaeota archaeon]|nr:MAG: Tungstate uptake system permease protein TupB [Candidatus Lokiarchaeota archaeon]
MGNDLIEGIVQAFILLFTFDSQVWGIMWLSIRVSLTSIFFASLMGIPIGSFIGLRKFRGKSFLTNIINTFMGFPPVVMGLIVFFLLSRSGPLGNLGLLYSPTAMIVAQMFLATPIVTGTTKAAIESIDPNLKQTVISLGATETQLWWQLIKESRRSIIAGILVGFGQIISEVGAVLLVGGNIEGYTRTFTTAIVLNTRMGQFGMAIALGSILILITFILNYALTYLQTRED